MSLIKQIKKHQPLAVELFYRVFDMREGEEKRSFLMWTYIFLVISALMIVKPMVNALFLSTFGAERLPQVFILVAIVAAVFSITYSSLLKSIDLRRLITHTLYTVIGLFLIFWFLLTFNWLVGGALYTLYVIVAVFAVISSSQFWIMANVLFNAREAKRLFGFIGSGAIAGGIFGGYLTNFLAPLIGSENLILIFLLFLGICLYLVNQLWREDNSAQVSHTVLSENVTHQKQKPWQLIRSSRHLSLLAALVGLGVLTGKLVEFQFSAIASEKIWDPDELTAFFGFWLSNLNIVTLIIQLFITRRVVGVFGVGTSLFFLPAAIFISAIALFIFPELWAAVLIKICDGSLKNSLNKSGMELLALPIAIDIRTQAKSFIDVFVDSFATGLGGIFLIGLTGILNVSVQQVSLLTIALIGIWFYMVVLIRREYVKSFRLKIEPIEISDKQETIDLTNESVISGISKVLRRGNEKQILQVLRMLRPLHNERLVVPFQELLNHKSCLIQLEVLKQVYFYKNIDLSKIVHTLITNENLDLRSEAIQYLYHKKGDLRNKLLLEFLNSDNYMIRSGAVICAARESRNNKNLRELFAIEDRIEKELIRIKDVTNTEEIIAIKRSCARSIGEGNIKTLLPFLNYMLHDTEPLVVKAAIIGAGLSKEKEFGSILIQLLKDPAYWTFSQTALVNFGSEIIDILNNHLKNPFVDRRARLNIPTVLGEIELQASVDALFRNINIEDKAIRNEIINALYRLRNKSPYLKFNEPDIMQLIYEEANEYLHTLSFLYYQSRLDDKSFPKKEEGIPKARRLLIHALEERLDRKLKRIFMMLGLKYPPNDIQNIYNSFSSSDTELRINAVEFLDNLLDTDLKKLIIPIVESTIFDDAVTKSIQRFSMKPDNEQEYLETVLNSDDNLLRYRSLELIGLMKDRKYLPVVAKYLNDHDERIRKLAKSIIENFGL
jgi:AAA family ATP:ADP antiporter